jgi:hypothetical protein
MYRCAMNCDWIEAKIYRVMLERPNVAHGPISEQPKSNLYEGYRVS